MDSIKTIKKDYVECETFECIAQITVLAESGKFRIYVAWENEDMAKKGVFGFAKSRKLFATVAEIDQISIMETANYGFDIGCTGEEKKVFKNLF